VPKPFRGLKRTITSRRNLKLHHLFTHVQKAAEHDLYVQLYPQYTRGNSTDWQGMAVAWNRIASAALHDAAQKVKSGASLNAQELPVLFKNTQHLQAYAPKLVDAFTLTMSAAISGQATAAAAALEVEDAAAAMEVEDAAAAAAAVHSSRGHVRHDCSSSSCCCRV
jgi:hypothetical protein